MAKHWKKPESKQCKCGAIFSKIGNQTDKHWDQTMNCPKCRKRKASKKDRQDHHGGWIINPILDSYLRGGV